MWYSGPRGLADLYLQMMKVACPTSRDAKSGPSQLCDLVLSCPSHRPKEGKKGNTGFSF